MFVYFDESGTLKEVITEKPFRVGDSKRDKIYVYWEGEHSPISGWVKYRKPDGTFTAETCFFEVSDSLVGKSLPTKPLRNLKYFSYDHTYEEDGEQKIGYLFYEITVPDEVLNSSSEDEIIPTSNNMIVANVRFIMIDNGVIGDIDATDIIESMGSIVFSVETNIGILTDNSINESQYNYLLFEISKKMGASTKSIIVNALPTVGTPNTVYYVNQTNSTYFNCYLWNGNEYVFIGSTNIDLGNYASSSSVKILENRIDILEGGSPKGVYATVAALTSANPNHNYIYIVLEDGHWYYWGGSEWEDGGVYLSSLPDAVLDEDSQNSIQNKTVFETINETIASISGNLIDEETYDAFTHMYISSQGSLSSFGGDESVKIIKLKYGESLRIKVKNGSNRYSYCVYCLAGESSQTGDTNWGYRVLKTFAFTNENGSIEHYFTNDIDPIVYVGVCYDPGYDGNVVIKYTPKKTRYDEYDIVDVLENKKFNDVGHYIGKGGDYPLSSGFARCTDVFSVKSNEILLVKGRTTGTNIACAGRMNNKNGDRGYPLPLLPYDADATMMDEVLYMPTQDVEYFRLSIYPTNYINLNGSRAFILKPKQQAYKESNLKQELQMAGKLTYLSLLCQRALCIGDSLTEGYCAKDSSGEVMNSNYSYPFFLAKMTSWYIDNAGMSGITPVMWWDLRRNLYDYTKYQFFFLFLGGNGTLTDTIEEDTNNDDDDYENYANTQTGRYCSIIKMIQTLNPDAKLFILNGYANKEMITKIAEFYEIPEIRLDKPMENLLPVMGSQVEHLFNHSHPSIKGYLNMAVDVLTFVTNYIFENPDEFVMTPQRQTTWNYNIMHESNLPTEDGDYYLTVSTDGVAKNYSFTKKTN